MADNAVTKAVKAVDDLMRELERVREALLKKGRNAESRDENCIQSLRALTESLHKRNEERPVTRLQITSPMVAGSGQPSEEVVSAEPMEEIREDQIKLLARLPASSASEDKIIIQKLRNMAIRFPDVRTIFGYRGAINQILNPTSVLRSRSDDALQCFMVELLVDITYFGNNVSKSLHECPSVIPFLVACLTSQTAETRSSTLRVLYWLSLKVSNRKVIGESGAMKPLVESIQGKDSLGLFYAASIIFGLCKVVENKERAVSEGVVIAVMDKIRSGDVLVNEMLEILEMLRGHEKAIEQMEENGVVECLFGILGKKDVRMEDKELCVSVFRAICGDDVAKTRKLVNEVENARDILERVVSSGIAKAKEKANELLSKLDSAENHAVI